MIDQVLAEDAVDRMIAAGDRRRNGWSPRLNRRDIRAGLNENPDS